jgi:hypothetical protein
MSRIPSPRGRRGRTDGHPAGWLDAYVQQTSMFDGLAQPLAISRGRPATSRAPAELARSAGGALVARAAAAGLVRDDIDIDDVLHMVGIPGEGRLTVTGCCGCWSTG